MKLLDEHKANLEQIYAYFGYVEDWRVLPLNDAREYYWRLDGEGPGTVTYSEVQEALDDEDAGDVYEDQIYTQRHLPKWVYRGAEYTMIVVDTQTDGNQFLQIFDNAKERP